MIRNHLQQNKGDGDRLPHRSGEIFIDVVDVVVVVVVGGAAGGSRISGVWVVSSVAVTVLWADDHPVQEVSAVASAVISTGPVAVLSP